ncbi:MAG: hypothetical protein J1F35_07915 [Erysipelotrichales bacterium]|nr:hypothetical protein [Erysipelotrichales bacterium]
MKHQLMYIIIFFIVIAVLIASFLRLDYEKKTNSSVQDINVVTKVDDVELNVLYVGGNIIDEVVEYGNKVSKIINITNDTETNISFAVNLSEVYISDNYLTYSVSYSFDEKTYTEITKNITINKDDNLAYNLVIAASTKLSIKIEFYGNNESQGTELKGKFGIISNLTAKDIFRKDVLAIHSSVLSSINSINDINESGYFIYDLSNISSEVLKNYNGYVMIDANNYSEPVFHYFIYNDLYMLDNYNLKNNDVEKKFIKDIDVTKKPDFNFENVCREFTKKNCRDFSELRYDPNGGKDTFYKNSIEVINKVKGLPLHEKKVYIFDVKKDIENNTNIRGYILVNNTVTNPEYYIYLTNDIYMISGYNLTKLGQFNKDSKTIRTYNQSSYNLSSENMDKVCNFSGFTDCVLANGEKVN